MGERPIPTAKAEYHDRRLQLEPRAASLCPYVWPYPRALSGQSLSDAAERYGLAQAAFCSSCGALPAITAMP